MKVEGLHQPGPLSSLNGPVDRWSDLLFLDGYQSHDFYCYHEKYTCNMLVSCTISNQLDMHLWNVKDVF